MATFSWRPRCEDGIEVGLKETGFGIWVTEGAVEDFYQHGNEEFLD